MTKKKINNSHKICNTCQIKASISELRAIIEWYNEFENNRRAIRTSYTNEPIEVREQQNYVSAMLSLPA